MHEECMLATSRVLHLVEMFLMVTVSVATEWNHVLFYGPLFSNSTSWIFHSIQVTLLVNVHHYILCHKLTVVPSVASGKSVKSRTPLICCSWLRVCSSNVNFRILRLSMASFAKFHDCVSCILWHLPLHSAACIHLEWILKCHWFIKIGRVSQTQLVNILLLRSFIHIAYLRSN